MISLARKIRSLARSLLRKPERRIKPMMMMTKMLLTMMKMPQNQKILRKNLKRHNPLKQNLRKNRLLKNQKTTTTTTTMMKIQNLKKIIKMEQFKDKEKRPPNLMMTKKLILKMKEKKNHLKNLLNHLLRKNLVERNRAKRVDREPKIKEADLLVIVKVKRVLKPKLNQNPSSLKRRE